MSEVSRNTPCPCGSGKKYKRCCLVLKTELNTQRVDEAEVVNGVVNTLANKAISEISTLPNGYETDRRNYQDDFELILTSYCHLWNISKCANALQNEVLAGIKDTKHDDVFKLLLGDLKKAHSHITKTITDFSIVDFKDGYFITEVVIEPLIREDIYALKGTIVQCLRDVIALLISFPLSEEEKKFANLYAKRRSVRLVNHRKK